MSPRALTVTVALGMALLQGISLTHTCNLFSPGCCDRARSSLSMRAEHG
jgi:hypothetical protein